MKDKRNRSDEDIQAMREEIEAIRAQLDEVQNERDDLLGKLQRVSADYTNFQKRVSRQLADSIVYEKEHLIKTLLPMLDNFEHTLEKSLGAESVDVVLQGVRIVYDQMLDTLRSHGVETIQALDEQFDPSHHEAMMRREDPDREDNTVLDEFQKGYKLNGRVIRPSKVIVNKLACTEAPPQDEPSSETTDETPSTDDQDSTETEQ